MDPQFFLRISSRYFNSGTVHGFDKILSGLHSRAPFWWNAGYIKKCFKERVSIQNSNSGAVENYTIAKYPGSDPVTLEISEYLHKFLINDLAGAIVHGSIATDEKINYSDFDGLVIIRNEVFENTGRIKKVAEHLSKTYSLMIKGDPLQHHGWFILTEADLVNWPSYYFPPVLLNYSKSLLPNPLQIQLKTVNDAAINKLNLSRLVSSISNKLSAKTIPGNAYLLKNLLSEFMLLPALFLQARSGMGVYKKYSFPEARKIVPEHKWTVMDKISAIRASWMLNRGINLNNAPVIVTPAIKRKQIARSAEIPTKLKSQFDSKLINDMLQLSDYFLKAIK